MPPEDIIGAFIVEEGAIVADSYQGNSGHALFTDTGLFGLSSVLMELLVEDLITFSAEQRGE